MLKKDYNSCISTLLKSHGLAKFDLKTKQFLSMYYHIAVDEKETLLQTLVNNSTFLLYENSDLYLTVNNKQALIEQNVDIPDSVQTVLHIIRTGNKKGENKSAFIKEFYAYKLLAHIKHRGLTLVRLRTYKKSALYPYDETPNDVSGIMCQGRWLCDTIGTRFRKKEYGNVKVTFRGNEFCITNPYQVYEALRNVDTYVHGDVQKTDLEILSYLDYRPIATSKKATALLFNFVNQQLSDSIEFIDGKVYKNKRPYLPNPSEKVEGMLDASAIGDNFYRYAQESVLLPKFRWDITRRVLKWLELTGRSVLPYMNEIDNFETDCVTLWCLLGKPSNFNLVDDINELSALAFTPYDTPVKAAIYNLCTKVKKLNHMQACNYAEHVLGTNKDETDNYLFSSCTCIIPR